MLSGVYFIDCKLKFVLVTQEVCFSSNPDLSCEKYNVTSSFLPLSIVCSSESLHSDINYSNLNFCASVDERFVVYKILIGNQYTYIRIICCLFIMCIQNWQFTMLFKQKSFNLEKIFNGYTSRIIHDEESIDLYVHYFRVSVAHY